MRLPCEVIEDLLILYDEEACSPESKRLVEEHLCECVACTKYLQKLNGTEEMLSSEVPPEPEEETEAVKSGFRKIRRRWRRALTFVAMLFPVLGMILLGVNEFRGEGIAFTNLDDIYRTRKYLYYIEKKDFDSAVKCVNFTTMDYQLIDSVKDMSEEAFQQYMEKRYLQKIREYDDLGIWISDIRFDTTYRMDDVGNWNVEFSFTEHYPDGSSQEKAGVTLDSYDMFPGTTSVPADSDKELYLGYVLHLWIQDDPLGYSGYETSFVLEKGEKAIISWEGMQKLEGDIRDIALINKSFRTILSGTRLYHKQESIEVVVPGEYALSAFLWDGQSVNLADYVDIEIVSYEE